MEAELSRWQLAYETISTLMTSVAGTDPTAIWRPLLYYPIDVNEMYLPLLRENGHASDGRQVVTPVHFCTHSVDRRIPVARAPENMPNPTGNRMRDDSQLRTEIERTSHRSAPCHSTNEVGALNISGNLEEPQNANWRTFIIDQESSTPHQQHLNTHLPSSPSQHDRSRLIRVANDDHRHRHLPNFSREGARRRIDGDIIYENHSLQRPFRCDMNLPSSSQNLSSEDGRTSVRNMGESDTNRSVQNRVNACDLFHRLMKNFYTETFLWIYVNTLLHPGSRRILNRIRFLALETGRSLQQATYDMLSGFLNGYQHSRLPLLAEIDRSLREISVESFQMRYPTESNVQSVADVERGAHLRQLSLELGAVLNPRQMLRSFGSVVREVSMQTIASPGHQQRNFLHQFHDWSYPTAGQDPFFFPGHSISQRGYPDNGLPVNFVHPWQTIPPPPPPYPGFLLHFLAMLDQPSVPQEIPDYYHVDDFDTYESLSELADRLGEAKLSGLTDSDIDQLPVYFYQATDVRRESSSLQDTCVICLGQFEKGHRLRMLPCGHDYHDKCIDRWLKMKSTCPVCRCHLNTSFS